LFSRTRQPSKDSAALFSQSPTVLKILSDFLSTARVNSSQKASIKSEVGSRELLLFSYSMVFKYLSASLENKLLDIGYWDMV